MSLPPDNGRSEGENDQQSTDTDSAPRSGGSSTPRFSSCHGQLKFGSCASNFHPPPVIRSGPSSFTASSSSLTNSASTSPKPHEAKMASSFTTAVTTDAIAAPSPATTTDTVVPSSTFSTTSTRSPSVSSVSSLRSRTSFVALANLKANVTTSPFAVEPPSCHPMPSHDVSAVHFNPALPDPVIETQRRVVAAGSTPPAEKKDEEEETITLPVKLIKEYQKELASMRKDRDQLRREVARQIDFHRQMVALCEENTIRIPKGMYAALAPLTTIDHDDMNEDDACEESSEDSQILY